MDIRPLFPSFCFDFYRLLLPGEDSWVEQLFIVVQPDSPMGTVHDDYWKDYDWETFYKVIDLDRPGGLPEEFVDSYYAGEFFFDEFLAEKLADELPDNHNFTGIQTTASYWTVGKEGEILDGGEVVGVKTKIRDEHHSRVEDIRRKLQEILTVNGVPLNIRFDGETVEVETEAEFWSNYSEYRLHRPDAWRWHTIGPDRGAIKTYACPARTPAAC